MTKTLTKAQTPGTKRTTLKAKTASNGAPNSNGKAAPAKKVPIRDTLPRETNPELLRAHRLLVKAAASIRAYNEQQRLLEQQEQERQGES